MFIKLKLKCFRRISTRIYKYALHQICVTDLHSYRTEKLNKHVQKWATYLCDAKFIAKLSEGDMVATEALYHKKCLTKLYNQFKSQKKAGQPESEILRAIERKAISDVVNYVKDTVRTCHEINSTPVFTQTLLTDM